MLNQCKRRWLQQSGLLHPLIWCGLISREWKELGSCWQEFNGEVHWESLRYNARFRKMRSYKYLQFCPLTCSLASDREFTMSDKGKKPESWPFPSGNNGGTLKKGCWTHKLIVNHMAWMQRNHSELNYHLTQALMGYSCFRSYTEDRQESDTWMPPLLNKRTRWCCSHDFWLPSMKLINKKSARNYSSNCRHSVHAERQKCMINSVEIHIVHCDHNRNQRATQIGT